MVYVGTIIYSPMFSRGINKGKMTKFVSSGRGDPITVYDKICQF